MSISIQGMGAISLADCESESHSVSQSPMALKFDGVFSVGDKRMLYRMQIAFESKDSAALHADATRAT
jgi:hypothetical protein